MSASAQAAIRGRQDAAATATPEPAEPIHADSAALDTLEGGVDLVRLDEMIDLAMLYREPL